MTTRAKFVVQSRTEIQSGYTIILKAVTGTSEENASFFKFTPNGTLDLGLVQPDTAAAFIPGTEFYLDFTAVEQ